MILSERGVLGAVRQVVNWNQFREYFGSYTPGANGAYALQGFFDNGGAMAYVTRLKSTAVGKPTAASVELVDGFKVKAGYKGQEDPGEWGNQLSVEITVNSGEEDRFDLTVYLKGVKVETKSRLPKEQGKAATILNNDSTGSKYIMVETDGIKTSPRPRKNS